MSCNNGTPVMGGNEMRKLFHQDEKNVLLNHGAYGLSPNPVIDRRIAMIREQDKAPDVWFRISSAGYYRKAAEAACHFINGEFEDFFLVDNATTGTNTVLKSLNLQAGDEILLTTHSYQAVKNTVDELKEINGVGVQFIEIPIPISSSQEVVELYKEFLTKYPKIKLAIVDHITSPSALLLPLDEILALCQEHGVMTFVDGAHAPGQLPLDVKKIKTDFYVGNFHKWTYGPRSSAFLHLSPKFRGRILPLVTSNMSHLSMHHRFAYMGTRDTTNHFALDASFDFYEMIGGRKALTAHANAMFEWAVPLLCEALGTKPLDIPEDMKAPFMRVIGLPDLPEEYKKLPGYLMIPTFYRKYAVVAGFTNFAGKMWLRVSINAYNSRNDVIRLRDALLDFFFGAKTE